MGGSLGEVAWDWALPLLASEARQPVRLGLTLRDLVFADRLWDRLDPGRVLPREPLAFDLLAGGEVTLPFDMVDEAAWQRLAVTPGLPFELNSASLFRT